MSKAHQTRANGPMLVGAFAVVLVVAIMAWRFARVPLPDDRPPVPDFVATELPLAAPPPAGLRPLRATPFEAAASSITPRPDPRATGSPLAAEFNAPGGTAQRDVEALHGMLRQYLRLLHQRQGLPIGNDTDLLRVLTGHNPMKLVVLPPTHPAVAADGRLRDRWGTPYFIHPRGNAAFEIRSAGPDRKLFTADDLVANPVPVAPASKAPEADR